MRLLDATGLVPVGIMALGQFIGQGLNAHAFGTQQDDEMVDEVGTFIDQLLFCASDSFYHGLNVFLTNLLCNFVDAFAEEAGSVTVLRQFLSALVDEVLQFAEKFHGIAFVGVAPACVGAFVTDGTVRIDFDQ